MINNKESRTVIILWHTVFAGMHYLQSPISGIKHRKNSWKKFDFLWRYALLVIYCHASIRFHPIILSLVNLAQLRRENVQNNLKKYIRPVVRLGPRHDIRLLTMPVEWLQVGVLKYESLISEFPPKKPRFFEFCQRTLVTPLNSLGVPSIKNV